MSEQPSGSEEVDQQRQLLVDAAAEIRADQIKREKARPQNVGEGTLRLVGESLGGVALGAAAVVMGPVQGYKESGPKGILSGTLGGLAVGVASTTLGIGSGIANFAQGASKTAKKLNPPSSDPRLAVSDDNPHVASRDSDHSASIKDIYLEERATMYGSLMAEFTSESAAASMDGLSAPVDNELYTVLAVDVDATPAQIRKAYYRMAQKYHPDKHPDDPHATEQFQKVGHAYQILSDPVKREEYHRLGAAATNDNASVDPKALFALMFADFEHIVGDLATATILNTEGAEAAAQNANENLDEAALEALLRSKEARERKRQQFQAMREAHLIKLLNKRLEPWHAGNEETFISHAKHEVMYLRTQPFGRDCLRSAAYIYRLKASKLLSNKGPLSGISNFFDDVGDKAHNFRSQIRALEGGVKAMTASTNVDDDETIDEQQRREAVSTLGAVWLASVVDIESTLRKVVSSVLHLDDKSLSKSSDVISTAQGLMVLAKIFRQA